MGFPFPNPRYERKFIAEGFTLAEALALVRRHRAAFREAFPPRIVNNIYLDSPSRTAYYDHINGCPRRVKHRVRWYGPLDGQILQPILERKFKSGSISGKDSHALAPFQLNGQPVRASLAVALNTAALPEQLRAELNHLTPCLLNRYHRHYFVSADRKFRLTVDSDFQFAAAHSPSAKISPGRPGLPSVVLEVKFDVQCATHAELITDSLPMRLSRCSKFILGIESL
ncbi:MAG TPA: polyphosphate polymerase domain-containing protein [Candidatus Limnocylindrales bacterium]|jgi:SPX domain protein involved in polyphosphate accumulation|nr:polyphosphate polymerase domain-containing protein [Candidatus Limnocylindrales bacterium]